ncbi:armadillo repeat-containing protein 1-like [Dysidea avara]|uniref:armadillo repeat-containing protein 1-like n=1 Tax=Dysidea avara TaxID=196820 RepID=UPI0033187665
MDVLKVVQQLRDLAKEPQNRVTIIKDQGCLPGLILFLDNGDDRVVLTALEALQYLAQLPSNRPTMKKELGMLVSLRTLVNRTGANPEVRKMAQTVHDMLVIPAATARPLSQSRVAGKGNVFLGASNKRAKVILLQINGLVDANTRRMVEEQLLSVKGIISFTFDMSHRRCTIRGRADLKPQSLCEAIAKTGVLNAEQVVRNEQGEEVFLTFGTAPTARSGLEKENSTPIELPTYLPEELDPEKSKKAVATTDSGERGGSWFASVGNFLAKSFYW